MILMGDVGRGTSCGVFINTLNVFPLSLCIYRYVPHNGISVDHGQHV